MGGTINQETNKIEPKTNPIYGTVASTFEAGTKKVIRGGAFDELCRRVISPSREGLEYNKCQSKYGTQANVGFRPSLTYTYDSAILTSNSENTGPIDIFFLFDASSSQNNNIKEMVDSARNIVKYYAGTAEHKSWCKVTSALFMGPSIRMMLSHRFKSKLLNQFVTLPYPGADGTDWVWGCCPCAKHLLMKKYEDAKK